MCLLVQQPATVSFTDAFLNDVYSKNHDGLGIMYAADGKVHVYKCLPANAQDFVDFYRKHGENKDCIWHARMRTHGDVDHDNCHPYHVTDDIYLAHNGVLSTGNKADDTKSDTWHFIKHVMRPALTANPDLMLDEEWLDFIGDIIGSGNKFGLMRSDGKSAVINRDSGLEVMQSWLSNTYAWTPSKFGVASRQTTSYYSSRNDYRWSSAWDKEDRPTSQTLIGMDDIEPVRATEAQVRRFVRAAYNQWTRRSLAGVEQWVRDAPDKAAEVLAFWYSDVDDVEDLAYDDPDEAATWIEDLFRTDSVTPSWLS